MKVIFDLYSPCDGFDAEPYRSVAQTKELPYEELPEEGSILESSSEKFLGKYMLLWRDFDPDTSTMVYWTIPLEEYLQHGSVAERTCFYAH